MQQDSIDCFFAEAYLALPAVALKQHKHYRRNKATRRTRQTTSPRNGLPADHPLAVDQLKCMRYATSGLSGKKRSRRKVYVEDAEVAIALRYGDPVVVEDGSADNGHDPQAEHEAQAEKHADIDEWKQPAQKQQQLLATQANLLSIEHYQQAWLSQRQEHAELEIARFGV